ncbi:MAG: 23S rRNA (guanosine(2251)-2'-O)-methyltransferase RlmB [bacterium]
MKVFGVHPVEEVLQTASEHVRSVASARWDASELARVRELCDQFAIRRQSVSKEQLDEMTDGARHQGIIAELAAFRYATLEDVTAATQDATSACVLVLDQVQDPQNLGAILRTAAGMGADAVVIPKDRAAEVTATVIRASAGLAFRVPVVQVTNVARCLDQLKEAGYWSVGTFMDGEKEAWDLDLRMKTALVMGGEHKGIRPLVERNCDFRVQIPLADGVESLNVATAAAILLYEFRRQNH